MTASRKVIHVIITDSHRVLREGVDQILHDEKDIKVVGHASNCEQTLALVRDLSPDIALLNIAMPEMGGTDIIRAIDRMNHNTKTIIAAAALDDSIIYRALRAGAKGYLPREAGKSDLIRAIRIVYQGELWMDRKIIANFFEKHTDFDFKKRDGNQHRLTEREKEILRCLIAGCTNKEIAKALSISDKTVKSHLNSVFKKFNVTRRIQAIKYAVDRDIL